MKFGIILLALIGLAAPAANAASLLVDSVSTSMDTRPVSEEATVYTATFNLEITAVDGDVLVGLPSSAWPAIHANSVLTYRNGVAGPLNAVVTVGYNQPPETEMSSERPGFFIVKQNQSVRMPIRVAFKINHPGNNVFGVQLTQFNWFSDGGKDTTGLAGSQWIAGSGGGSTPPHVCIPYDIQSLRSRSALIRQLTAQATQIQFYVWSPGQQGEGKSETMELDGGATETAIREAMGKFQTNITMANLEADVYFYTYVFAANNAVIMFGGVNHRPIPAKAGKELPVFRHDLFLNYDIYVNYPGATSARINTTDGNNNIVWQGLEADGNGFRFPVNAAGAVTLEVRTADGNIVTYDLRTNKVVQTQTLEVVGSASKELTDYYVNPTEVNIIPATYGGVGRNRTAEILVTQGQLSIAVTAMTEEFGKAKSITVQRIRPSMSAPQTVPTPNGVLFIQNIDPGEYWMWGDFPESVLREPPYIIGGN